MIDIGIGAGKPPELRIGGKIPLHVFVDKLLQIEPLGPQRANDDIGADAAIGRDIAHRISEPLIGRVIGDAGFCLVERGGGEAPAEIARRGGGRQGGEQGKCEEGGEFRHARHQARQMRRADGAAAAFLCNCDGTASAAAGMLGARRVP